MADLKRQDAILPSERDGIGQNVLTLTQFVLAHEVSYLAHEVALYYDVLYTVGAASDIDALLSDLKACEIKRIEQQISLISAM